MRGANAHARRQPGHRVAIERAPLDGDLEQDEEHRTPPSTPRAPSSTPAMTLSPYDEASRRRQPSNTASARILRPAARATFASANAAPAGPGRTARRHRGPQSARAASPAAEASSARATAPSEKSNDAREADLARGRGDLALLLGGALRAVAEVGARPLGADSSCESLERLLHAASSSKPAARRRGLRGGRGRPRRQQEQNERQRLLRSTPLLDIAQPQPVQTSSSTASSCAARFPAVRLRSRSSRSMWKRAASRFSALEPSGSATSPR